MVDCFYYHSAEEIWNGFIFQQCACSKLYELIAESFTNKFLVIFGNICKDLVSVSLIENCDFENLMNEDESMQIYLKGLKLLKNFNYSAAECALSSVPFRLLNDSPLLQSVSIEGINVKALFIQKLMIICKLLTTIGFGNIFITDQLLQANFSSLVSLTLFNTESTSDVTNEGIKALVQYCSLLKALDIIGSKLTTDESIVAIVSCCLLLEQICFCDFPMTYFISCLL